MLCAFFSLFVFRRAIVQRASLPAFVHLSRPSVRELLDFVIKERNCRYEGDGAGGFN